jgi:NitT/TauT family transport system substrate-binding protein
MYRKINGLILAGVFLMSACAPAPTQDAATPAPTAAPTVQTEQARPVKLKVGVLNYVSYSPFFIALEEGYFTEQGLEVELINPGTANLDIIPPLLQRQMDAGTSLLSAAVLNSIAQGGQIRYVADKGLCESGCRLR